MEILVVFMITFIMIAVSLYHHIFVGFPLLAGLVFFTLLSFKQGVPPAHISAFLRSGVQRSLLVIKIFMLIGLLTAAWMSSGTVPAIVYYGLQVIHPDYFYFTAFSLSCLVSFLLGTSLGTISTLGVALMMLARSGQAHIPLATGALVAGAYFGDRFSPMSSSANLVANITGTNLFDNLHRMAKTMWVPLGLSLTLYLAFSLRYPLQLTEAGIDQLIKASFIVHPVTLLPAITMLMLSLFKVGVKRSMALSMLTAVLLALLFQEYSIRNMLVFLLSGFSLQGQDPLSPIIRGGGILSMVRPAFIVMVSCALAEVIHGAHFLKGVTQRLVNSASRFRLLLNTMVVSLMTGGFGGTQAVAVILTAHVMEDAYKHHPDVGKEDLAVDVENTAIVLSALIPWNIASLIPTTLLEVDRLSFIPFAFFLYLLPFCNLVHHWRKTTR